MARRPRRASSRKPTRFQPAFEVAETRESPTSLWGLAAPLGAAAVHVANTGTAQPGAGGKIASTETPSRNAVTFQPPPSQHTTGMAHSAPPQPPAPRRSVRTAASRHRSANPSVT